MKNNTIDYENSWKRKNEEREYFNSEFLNKINIKKQAKGDFMKFIKKWKLLFLLILCIIMLNSYAVVLGTAILAPTALIGGACIVDPGKCP